MKKYRHYLLIGGALLALTACSNTKSSTTTQTPTNNGTVNETGTTQVKGGDMPIEDILIQARKSIGNGIVTSVDYEVGHPNYYEVDIYVENQKYELQFDALTGEIFKQEQTSENPTILDGVNISIDEAISIAAARSNGGLVHSIHLQPKEIGVVYEATAIKNNKEQKIEISATDGKVISFEEEVND